MNGKRFITELYNVNPVSGFSCYLPSPIMSVATWRHTGNVRIYPPHDPVPQTFIKLRLITSAGRKDQIRKAAHHSSSSSCSHSTLVLPPSPNSPSPHSGRGVWLCAAAA